MSSSYDNHIVDDGQSWTGAMADVIGCHSFILPAIIATTCLAGTLNLRSSVMKKPTTSA